LRKHAAARRFAAIAIRLRKLTKMGMKSIPQRVCSRPVPKENIVNKLLVLCTVLIVSCVSSVVRAQEITDVVAEGNYRVLGGETFTASASISEGWAPVNDTVTFVYDPQFHFFMRGYVTDPLYDRRAEFESFGYVVVAAAGDPGGNSRSAPSWISHDSFSGVFADGEVDNA
jgi:hypothetical protein